jgi:hypothetical protein
MKSTLRVLSVLILCFTALATMVEVASAQSIVRAVYRVSMTDPASGNVYYVDRESIRSWGSEERCESEKGSFSGFHTNAMSKQKIMNAEGTPLEVRMDSVFCVVIRE